MKNYRIAFFTVDWNYELVESTLHGLKKYVEDHENVEICVFDCFGKDTNEDRSRTEYTIFDLPDLQYFDGLLVQGNQVVLSLVREELGGRIMRLGIPAVTIDCPIDGCTLVGIDNKMAQHDITAHVIQAHGARRLVYLTGILENGCLEGHQRLDGFLTACREADLPAENVEVIRCSWRTSDGMRVASEWVNGEKKLPDAFICANDEMAMGLMETLEMHGLRIPQDVIVTGFDDVASAALSSPRLSTVHRDHGRLNYAAMDVLLRLIDGVETRKSVPFPYELVLSESCGCGEAGLPEYVRSQYFQQTRFLKNFYLFQDRMAGQMFEAADLPGLMTIVEKNQEIFGCDNIYLCINDYYYDNYEKKNWHHDSETFGEEMILAACGKSDAVPDEKHQYARFPTKDLLPFDLIHKRRFLVFYPLHYNTYSIGYLVMDGISKAAKLNLHESIFSFLEIAIENVRKKCLLKRLNETLDDLYVHDGLTGVYNRFGLKRFGQKTFDRLLRRDGKAQVLFIDMDDMKGINDRYSHEIGDAAIRTVAEVLKATFRPDDFILRYGGDEFMVIASGAEGNAEEKILRDAREKAAQAGFQFDLGLSVGTAFTTREEALSLDECVRRADAQMYKMKDEKKVGRSTRPME